jgi:hypothetical protein
VAHRFSGGGHESNRQPREFAGIPTHAASAVIRVPHG